MQWLRLRPGYVYLAPQHIIPALQELQRAEAEAEAARQQLARKEREAKERMLRAQEVRTIVAIDWKALFFRYCVLKSLLLFSLACACLTCGPSPSMVWVNAKLCHCWGVGIPSQKYFHSFKPTLPFHT